MEKTITIVREDVYKEIEELVAYVASKNDTDAAAYNRMNIIDEDHNLLNRYWDEACANIKVELEEFLKQDNVSVAGRLKLDFILPSNFDTTSFDGVANGIKQYIINKIIADWFAITNKTEVEYYTASALQSIERAKVALFKRNRPERPIYN